MYRASSKTVVPGAVAAALVASLALAACDDNSNWGKSHTSAPTMDADRPECARSWQRVPVYDSVRISRDSVTGTTSAVEFVSLPNGVGVAGPITNIPEFHDCQKFIRNAHVSPTYDSLFAVFAARAGDSILTALQWESVTWSSSQAAVATVDANGVVTAVGAGSTSIVGTSTVNPQRKVALSVVVQPGPAVDALGTLSLHTAQTAAPGAIRPGDTFSVVAAIGAPTTATLALAQVYSYGPGYAPLGIGPNFSCLYLYFDSVGHLKATMIPAPGASAEACTTEHMPTMTNGTPLTVSRAAYAGSGHAPTVARWEYDHVNQQYYIGITCGNAWCSVGAPADRRPGEFSPKAPRRAYAGASPAEARVMTYNGFYDEQYLAITDSYGNSIPTTLLGAVTPDPRLPDLVDADFKEKWVPVAYVGLVDTLPGADIAAQHYRRKFNFAVVGFEEPLQRQNVLSLCYGGREKCRVPKPATAKGCGPDKKWVFWTVNRWWVRIDRAGGGAPMYRCVTRREHTGGPQLPELPSTARWRWLAADETIWEECVRGCCETEGDQMSPGWP